MFDGCEGREIDKDECNECSHLGFRLDKTKKCEKIPYCSISDGKKDCLECNTGFYLYSS